jgi:hypothetical protein
VASTFISGHPLIVDLPPRSLIARCSGCYRLCACLRGGRSRAPAEDGTRPPRAWET